MASKKTKAQDALTQAYDQLKSAHGRSAEIEICLGGLTYEDCLQSVVEDMQAGRLVENPPCSTQQELKQFILRETLCRLGNAWVQAQEQAPLVSSRQYGGAQTPPSLADDMPTLLALTMLALEDQPKDQRILQAIVDVEYNPRRAQKRLRHVNEELSKRLGLPVRDIENAKKRIKRRASGIVAYYRRHGDHR